MKTLTTLMIAMLMFAGSTVATEPTEFDIRKVREIESDLFQTATEMGRTTFEATKLALKGEIFAVENLNKSAAAAKEKIKLLRENLKKHYDVPLTGLGQPALAAQKIALESEMERLRKSANAAAMLRETDNLATVNEYNDAIKLRRERIDRIGKLLGK